MKIRFDMDWSTHKKGDVLDVADDEGNRLIGTGVCSVLEQDKAADKKAVKPKEK